MPIKNLYSARRDIYRETLDRFGDELPWIADPSLIPQVAVEDIRDENNALDEMCGSLAVWMSTELGNWSSRKHGKTHLRDIFEKHELTNKERVHTRTLIQKHPLIPYIPGMRAVAQIHGVIPPVAARGGKDRSSWSEIGVRSSVFGASISRYGTDVQANVIEWMREDGDDVGFRLDVSRVRLDEQTGISTVAPFEEVLGVARCVSRQRNLTGMGESTCVALQAGSPVEGTKTFFDAVCHSFSAAADRLIYPLIDVNPTDVPPEGGPWPAEEIHSRMATVRLTV